MDVIPVLDPVLYTLAMLECQFDYDVHERSFNRIPEYQSALSNLQKINTYTAICQEQYGPLGFMDMVYFYRFLFQIYSKNISEGDLFETLKQETFDKKDRYLIDLIVKMWDEVIIDLYHREKPEMIHFLNYLQKEINLDSLLYNIEQMSKIKPDLSYFNKMYLVVAAYLIPHTFLININDGHDLVMALDYRRGGVVINSIVHELSHFYIGTMLMEEEVVAELDKSITKITDFEDFAETHKKWISTYPDEKDWLEEQIVKAFVEFYVLVHYGGRYSGFTGETMLSKDFQNYLIEEYKTYRCLPDGLKGAFLAFLAKNIKK